MAERSSSQGRGGPLQGMRVVELTKIWAGPYTGKLLAYLGAEVIRIESLESLDVTRSYGVADINNAPGFQAVNPQKLSVQIDMKKPEGVALILKLLAKSDLLVENLRPGAVKRLGLGYEAVRKVRPDIVFVSMGMYGTEGPLSYQTGYAPCFAALGGLSLLVGREGQPPEGMNIRYADSTYGAAAAYAAMVALLHRRRSGFGQFVDVSAVECMSSMVGDALMEFALSGQAPACDGNRHPAMVPHGAYPCQNGEWISLAVNSDEAWRRMAAAMGKPDLRFDTLAARQQHQAELDRLVSAWTTTQPARELAAQLQQHGIAASKSQSSMDLVADPQLWARGFYRDVSSPSGQSKVTVGPSWKMSGEASVSAAAPCLGEHNAQVLGGVLGLSEAELKRLAEAGITR